jgi:hypothetical protein
MPKKTCAGEFDGTKIAVENTWFGGAKLFIDDGLVASNNNLFAVNKKEPIMSATTFICGQEKLVEAFVYAMFFTKIMIKVDGQKIAGDVF